MLWYVAFVSIVNLAVGFALAVYFGAPVRRRSPDADDLSRWSDAIGSATGPAGAESTAAAAASADSQLGVDAAGLGAVGLPDESEPTGAGDGKFNVAAAVPIAPEDLDPATQLATREYGQQRLTELTATTADEGWASAMLLEASWTGPTDAEATDRLLRGMVGATRQLIDESGIAARHDDRQILLLIPGCSADQASERAEKLRQRVEATRFIADGTQWPATLTCALADVRGHTEANGLLDLLDEALAEARRYGGNRTFMHDGLSPAPVVPLDLGLEIEQCAI